MGKEHHHHHHHQSHGTGGFNILQISLFLCMHWCKLTSTGYCGKKGMTHYEPDIIIWHFMMPLRRKVVLSSLSFQVLVSLLFDFDYDRYVLGWKDFNITNLCCFWFIRTIVAKRNQHFFSVHRCRSSHGERFSATGVWGRSSRLGFSRSGTHGCHTGECQALPPLQFLAALPALCLPWSLLVLTGRGYGVRSAGSDIPSGLGLCPKGHFCNSCNVY